MSLDCSPAWVTQPPTTCSTSSGSMPARREHLGLGEARAAPPGCTPASQPLRLPSGVRTASTMTGLPMATKLEHVLVFGNASRSAHFRNIPGVCNDRPLERVPDFVEDAACDRTSTAAAVPDRVRPDRPRPDARSGVPHEEFAGAAADGPGLVGRADAGGARRLPEHARLLGGQQARRRRRGLQEQQGLLQPARTARSSGSRPDMTREQVELQQRHADQPGPAGPHQDSARSSAAASPRARSTRCTTILDRSGPTRSSTRPWPRARATSSRTSPPSCRCRRSPTCSAYRRRTARKLFDWSNQMMSYDDPEYEGDPDVAAAEILGYAMALADERRKQPAGRHHHQAGHRRRRRARR